MSFHILPTNDLEKHEETTVCKCEPKIKFVNGEMLVVHNAFDQREIIERVNEILDQNKNGIVK